MINTLETQKILKHLENLEREIVRLKRDILHGLEAKKRVKKTKPTLFGSIKSGDITEKMIGESKKNLFCSSLMSESHEK